MIAIVSGADIITPIKNNIGVLKIKYFFEKWT